MPPGLCWQSAATPFSTHSPALQPAPQPFSPSPTAGRDTEQLQAAQSSGPGPPRPPATVSGRGLAPQAGASNFHEVECCRPDLPPPRLFNAQPEPPQQLSTGLRLPPARASALPASGTSRQQPQRPPEEAPSPPPLLPRRLACSAWECCCLQSLESSWEWCSWALPPRARA